MKITHKYKEIKVQKEVEGGVGLVLGNDFGNYFYLPEEETKYQGLFYANGENYRKELEIYKVIDKIEILETGKITNIKNNFFEIGREYENGLSEKYFLPNSYNSLCVKLNKKSKAEVVFDIKYPYDTRNMGRYYSVEIKKNYALIKFTKRRDWSEDSLGDKKEFSLYVAIKTNENEYKEKGEFFSKYYPKDHKRNSYPWDRFVYKALEIEFENAVFSVAKTRNKAIEEAEKVFRDFDKLHKEEKKNIQKKLKPIKISDEEVKMANLCAQNSIYTMIVENNEKTGAYAGFPWFFQFWSRDEAISLLQIYKLNKNLGKEIILSSLENILDSGQVLRQRHPEPNKDSLQSADSLGWLADRIWKIIKNCNIKKDLKEKLVKEFEKAIAHLIQKRTENDLAINYKNETWMDSLEREGKRIEIQACRLRIYDVAYKLTKNDQYKIIREELKTKVRKEFYKEGILFDSPEDKTIRPNIFIAAYLYPKLLEENEWEDCFDKILPKLYLQWGGISTIDKTDKMFIPNDTGEINKSYHNGNSWYWINNLVALVLYKTNAHKYSEYINGIMEQNTDEILYEGIAGHHSETSSAEKKTSSGCGAQLWSSAMYLEVFDEILENNLIK